MFYEVEQHIALLEAFIASQNKPEFIERLNNPTEKVFLQILTAPIEDIEQFKKKLSKLQVSQNFKQAVLRFKLKQFIDEGPSAPSKKILEELKQLFSPYLTFSYEKPANLRKARASESQDCSDKSSISVLSKDLSEYINKKVIEESNYLSRLEPLGISLLTQKTLLSMDFRAKERFLRDNKYIAMISPPLMGKLFQEYLRGYKKEYISSQGIQTMLFPYEKLTKKQLNSLPKHNKDIFFSMAFCREWINQNFKSFSIQYSQASSGDLQKEKFFLEELLKIKEQLKTHQASVYLSIYEYIVLTEIVATEIQLGAPKETRLIEFIGNEMSLYFDFPYFTEKFRGKFSKKAGTNKHILQCLKTFKSSSDGRLRGALKGVTQLAEEYIMLLFKHEDKKIAQSFQKKLSEMIQAKYLKQLEVKVKLMTGVKCDEATDFLSHNELTLLKNKREIKISERNQNTFRAEDDVFISLTLKNIQTLQIKVYELNLAKEYLTNNSPGSAYDLANFSYFSPTSTDSFENPSQNPFEDKKVTIEVKKIPKRTGTFVVDFQGQDITSRAVIRKGSILCLQEYSTKGQTFCFYDQDGKELTADSGLEIWCDKNQVPLTNGNSFDSSYLDLEKRGPSTEIIASLGCFAQKFVKSTLQQYTVALSAIYNSESFIKQSKAKVLLKASLMVNSTRISLKKLKKIRAVLSQFTGNVITSSNIFEFSSWDDHQEQLIEFFPQSEINSISIQLKTEIEDNKTIQVDSNTLKITLSSEGGAEESISQLYLKQLQDKAYELSLRGKNGEGIPQKQVNLTFQMKGTSQPEIFKFVTNQEGIISLGKLTSVRSVHFSGDNHERTWNIDQTLQTYNYDKVMYAFPGEQVTIPVSQHWTNKDVFLLHNLAEMEERNDETHSIKIGDGILSFPVAKKQSSIYKLTLLPINFQITIEVLSNGSKWSEKHQNKEIVVDPVEGKVCQVQRGSAIRNLSISQLIQSAQKDDWLTCKVNLNSWEQLSKEELETVRVHILATNFLSPNIEGGFSSSDHFLESRLTSETSQLNKSTYLSNKTLSEEAAYVLNRQKEKNRIGSNLEKPGIFLKRLTVRDTSDVVGQLGGEGNFDLKTAKAKEACRLNENAQRPLTRKYRYITKHNSFLALSGFALHNIPVGASFQVPKGFSHLQVFLMTPEDGTKATFSLPSKETKTKDTRYGGLPACGQGNALNISRQVYRVGKGVDINFRKQCEFKAVTLPEVFEFCEKIIFPAKQEKLYGWKDCFIQWGTFGEEKKIKLYNRFSCHEFNTFLKFKDPAFFAKIVRPFILNKFKKTFIDLCLLEDPSIPSFLTLRQLLLLNNFQSALFVHALMKMQLKEEAGRVVQKMQLIQSKVIPFKVKNSNFDFIINSFAGEEKMTLAPVYPAMEMNLGGMKVQRKMKRKTSQMALSENRKMNSESSEDQRQLSQCSEMSIPQPDKKKVEVESTKEYTEMTYYYDQGERYPLQEHKIINSPFWVELARHFLEGGDGSFTSSSFTEFNNGLQAMLAAAFIPGASSSPSTLQDAGDSYRFKASIPLCLFLKQKKEYPLKLKDGVYIYQTLTTFFPLDPNKEVVATQLRAGEKYYLSTIFSNSTSSFLDLQIVCPIAEGSVPLRSKEVTILQKNLGPFQTDVHKQAIYFPSPGLFKLQSANILDMSTGAIISISPVNLPITVIKATEGKALQSFEDIIQFGSKDEILSFLKTKNVFSANVFKPQLICWMLADPSFFSAVTTILRARFYFQPEIWKFSLLHGDSRAIGQYLDLKNWTSSELPAILPEASIRNQAFEYFPYFQKRTHRYASQSRSSIKCVDLKETYIRFLIYVAACSDYKDPNNKLAHAYYLILQDRLQEAQEILELLTEPEKLLCELQLNYIRCFLDVGLNGENCEIARKIAPRYADYPIAAWRKLFLEITQTLQAPPPNEAEKKQTIQTKVRHLQNGDLFIRRSPGKEITIEMFPTNIELFFSEHPFQIKNTISKFSISKSQKEILIESSNPETEITVKKEEFNYIVNPYIEVSEHDGQNHKKVKSLLWNDPRITTRTYQQEGVIQVFVDSNRAPGCYVKVFTLKKGITRPSSNGQYYVDGYTDIAGKFRYGLTDLQRIQEFALLIMTPVGAVVKYVTPPKVNSEGNKKYDSSSSSSGSDSDTSSVDSSLNS